MAEHAHITPDRRTATPSGPGGRRSLFASAAALALAGAGVTLATPAAAIPGPATDTLGQLAASIHRLMVLERKIDHRLGVADLDDAETERLCAALDAELTAAARIRPTCRHGFAVKARIVQQWGDLKAGEAVASALLSDLVLRGIAA